MAMMICVAFIGGGGVVSVVSVLCGAGGGLTVQPLNSSAGTDTSAPIINWARRRGVGTLLRVSTGSSHSCRALALRPAPSLRKWWTTYTAAVKQR